MSPGFNRWKTCRFGVMLYNANDRYVGRSLDLYGEYSHGESEIFRQLVRPGDVVVEVGANIGAHTLQLAQLTGPSGAVYAFEPQRLAFQTLCANMALNSIINAYCLQQAVGRTLGTVHVPLLDPHQTMNFGGLSLAGRESGERVSMTTIDALGLSACRLLKVDVEGMERDVLDGAVAMIHRTRPFLYIENDREATSADLIRQIAALGYDLYEHKPPLYSPANFLGNATNVFGRIVSLNVLGVPRGSGWVVEGATKIPVS